MTTLDPMRCQQFRFERQDVSATHRDHSLGGYFGLRSPYHIIDQNHAGFVASLRGVSGRHVKGHGDLNRHRAEVGKTERGAFRSTTHQDNQLTSGEPTPR